VSELIAAAQPGSVLVLENTRRYAIERVLWDAEAKDLPKLGPDLAKFANECAQRIAKVYVNEALSAGSLDSSTTVVPSAMEKVALGNYVAAEFDGPMRRCLDAQLVVFSGLKIDKLDDLHAMIDRGTIRWVFAAGSLSMAMREGAARLEGKDFSIGKAENPAYAKEPWYIPRQRVEQAQRMIAEGRKKGIEFVLPVDSILQDGRVSETIGPDDQQFDIGPKTSDLFERKIGEFLESARGAIGTGKTPVAFHNGVFGMFEDSRFEEGTRRFMRQLKRLKEAGVEVYVGGGEGGKALEKYGKPNWVTHVFTAGGTVLNALGSLPVPYLQALAMAAEK
jgi:phosphoglycerate kinase